MKHAADEQQLPALPRILAFGEALTDMIRQPGEVWRAVPGGAAWNVARAMRGLGLPAAFAGAISGDALGDQLFEASQNAGLDTRYVQRVARSPLLAMVVETAPPQYFFIGDDSADLHFDPAALPAGWQAAAEWAHFGGISLARAPLSTRLLALAGQLKRAGKRISYDPNFRQLMDQRHDPTLEAMCGLADVIKVSDEDLCGLFRHPDPSFGLAKLRAWNPQALLLLTQGAQGAVLFAGEQSWQARPPSVAVIDTVGAGDASMAGLMCSLLEGDVAGGATGGATGNPERHLRWAVAAGAAACTTAGASAPSLNAVAALAAGVVSVVNVLRVC